MTRPSAPTDLDPRAPFRVCCIPCQRDLWAGDEPPDSAVDVYQQWGCPDTCPGPSPAVEDPQPPDAVEPSVGDRLVAAVAAQHAHLPAGTRIAQSQPVAPPRHRDRIERFGPDRATGDELGEVGITAEQAADFLTTFTPVVPSGSDGPGGDPHAWPTNHPDPHRAMLSVPVDEVGDPLAENATEDTSE